MDSNTSFGTDCIDPAFDAMSLAELCALASRRQMQVHHTEALHGKLNHEMAVTPGCGCQLKRNVEREVKDLEGQERRRIRQLESRPSTCLVGIGRGGLTGLLERADAMLHQARERGTHAAE